MFLETIRRLLAILKGQLGATRFANKFNKAETSQPIANVSQLQNLVHRPIIGTIFVALGTFVRGKLLLVTENRHNSKTFMLVTPFGRAHKLP